MDLKYMINCAHSCNVITTSKYVVLHDDGTPDSYVFRLCVRLRLSACAYSLACSWNFFNVLMAATC